MAWPGLPEGAEAPQERLAGEGRGGAESARARPTSTRAYD